MKIIYFTSFWIHYVILGDQYCSRSSPLVSPPTFRGLFALAAKCLVAWVAFFSFLVPSENFVFVLHFPLFSCGCPFPFSSSPLPVSQIYIQIFSSAALPFSAYLMKLFIFLAVLRAGSCWVVWGVGP